MTEGELKQMLKDQEERNEALLEIIRSKRVDINQERLIEHHFWAPGPEEASLLAKRLYEKGFLLLKISPVTSDDSGLWNVEAGISQTPAQAASREMSEGLIRTAASFNSTYDGWGTS